MKASGVLYYQGNVSNIRGIKMKVVHLINLSGFGGVEKRFSMFIENSNINNSVICCSNKIDSRISNLFDDKKSPSQTKSSTACL